jgi:hypothetical protein
LDPGWRIANEDTGYWSLTDSPGNLRILTRFFATEPVNFFYHIEAITGDYSVSTRLVARADSAGQIAMLYADYDSLGYVPPAIIGYGNYMGMGTVVFAQINDTLTGQPYADTIIFLRIRTCCDTIFGEFSADSISWDAVGRSWNPLFHELQRSGLMAVNHADMGSTPQTPAMKADYGWFRLVSITGVDEMVGSRQNAVSRITARPNPFKTYSVILGRERDFFTIYDAAGKQVMTCRGDRVGEGLSNGVYFIQSGNGVTGTARVVKIRN